MNDLCFQSTDPLVRFGRYSLPADWSCAPCGQAFISRYGISPRVLTYAKLNSTADLSGLRESDVIDQGPQLRGHVLPLREIKEETRERGQIFLEQRHQRAAFKMRVQAIPGGEGDPAVRQGDPQHQVQVICRDLGVQAQPLLALE